MGGSEGRRPDIATAERRIDHENFLSEQQPSPVSGKIQQEKLHNRVLCPGDVILGSLWLSSHP